MAAKWKAIRSKDWSDFFWFHYLFDSIEIGRNNLEGALAIGLIVVVAIGYVLLTDWHVGGSELEG